MIVMGKFLISRRPRLRSGWERDHSTPIRVVVEGLEWCRIFLVAVRSLEGIT